MKNYRRITTVSFPPNGDRKVNMMPILMGVPESVPHGLRDYQPMIDASALELGSTVYLTIHESFVAKGDTQRRAGVHTDATNSMGWGGGGWGRREGIYMASTDGRTRVFDEIRMDVNEHGGVDIPAFNHEEMEPSSLYWITDRTPHESLPALRSGERQFFRLVSSEIGAWWSMHNTANPLGVLPRAPVIDGSKFGPMEARA